MILTKRTELSAIAADAPVYRIGDTWYSDVSSTLRLNLGHLRLEAEVLNRRARRELKEGLPVNLVEARLARTLGNNALLSTATVFELFWAHIYHFPGVEKFDEKTVGFHRRDCLNVLDVIYRLKNDLPPREVKAGQEFVVDQFAVAFASLDELIGPDFGETYLAAQLGDIQRDSAEARPIVRRVYKELIAMAQMFTEAGTMPAYAAIGINVPAGIPERLKIDVDLKASEDLRFLDEAKVPPAFALLHEYARYDHPQPFFILALALLCGLRRIEIATLNVKHLQRSTGPAIKITEYAKLDHHREVHLPEWLYLALHAYCSEQPGGDLIPGSLWAKLTACGLVAQELRTEVFPGAKHPLHRCRAFFAGFICADADTIPEIRLALGHNEIETTFTYYAWQPLGDHVLHWWKQVITLAWKPSHAVL